MSDTGPPRADAGPILPPPSEPGRHDVTVVDTRRVVPSAGLPAETPAMDSNNNLDVVRFGGRVYLAWRTSPDHYASANTVMNVVSSADEVTWRFEARYTAGTDLREPRFLPVGDRLFLYVSRLGAERLAFQPMGVSYAVREANGSWSTALTEVYQPNFLLWRSKVINGRPYLLGYFGGQHIYDFSGTPLTIELLTTTNGTDWTPIDPARRVVSMGGGSETDIAIGDDGTLFGVIRNEAGDEEFGLGSKVCRAPAGDLANWTCVRDPKKYDSPLMFWYDGEAYLIGRRNITATGNYDLMLTGSIPDQAIRAQLDYSRRPKKCSVWRYVQSENRIAFITDLPSNGDTCFASILETGTPGEFTVYNYSSDVDGPAVGWSTGQDGLTFIYRHTLRFTRR